MSKAPNASTFSSVGVSIVFHGILLFGLFLIKQSLDDQQEEIVVESVLNEDRTEEEYTQELELNPTPADSMNVVAGGAVTGAVGAAASPVSAATQNVEIDKLLEDPQIEVNPGDITRPGEGEVAMDLGEGEVTGEIGAIVEGYGAALSRLTQELTRIMREQKVLVVWLFDQSDSMKDDQKEIAANFHQVYEELGLVQKQDEKIRAQDEVLHTVIGAFGQNVSYLTPEPTTDVKKIREAIDKIKIDESGFENLSQAVVQTMEQYGPRAVRQKRRLVVVVVSDESGDDGMGVEEIVARAKKIKSPIYILGREATFGYPYARIRWQDPKYNLWHWLQIRRGPETAFPECLQWDGLHSRWDAFKSGFGPYEQVRICKESGGIFFVLPGEEEDLTGAGANDKRKFDFLDMKRYTPLLLPRREYAAERQRSDFRKTIFDVIARLNPNKDAVEKGLLPAYDPNLNIREHWYPLDVAGFRQEAAKEVQKAARAMALLNTGIGLLEGVQKLRAKEDSDRWRAAYDLAYAECLAYRVRLFQYLLAMDAHANNMPEPAKKNHNRWNVGRTPKMIVADDAQFKRLKAAFGLSMEREEYLKYVEEQETFAREMYADVIKNHPGTPWERRAEYELKRGFGMRFYSVFRDPNYDKLDIKLPKP